MVHLRRWHRLGLSRTAIVEWNGKPVKSVKTGFASAVREAGLDKHVTPHTLRHTAATWLMDEGRKVWTVAGFLGMSTQVLEATYAKHHPDYQVEMAGAFSNQSRKLSRSEKPR
jgi:integrase